MVLLLASCALFAPALKKVLQLFSPALDQARFRSTQPYPFRQAQRQPQAAFQIVLDFELADRLAIAQTPGRLVIDRTLYVLDIGDIVKADETERGGGLDRQCPKTQPTAGKGLAHIHILDMLQCRFLQMNGTQELLLL